MLSSQKAEPLDEQFVSTLRDLSLKVLTGGKSCPFIRTAKANTPLSADVIWAWGQLSGDPDAETLASWLRAGAPLFASPIPTNGIFPSVKAQRWEDEAACGLARSIQGWANHPSASQYSADLQTLVQDAINKGFCSLYNSLAEAELAVGRELVTGRSKESQDNLGPPGIGRQQVVQPRGADHPTKAGRCH